MPGGRVLDGLTSEAMACWGKCPMEKENLPRGQSLRESGT